MDYIIFPVEKLDKVPTNVLDELHLVPRKSVDGKQVVMKVVNYDKLFPKDNPIELMGMNLDNDGNEVDVTTYPYDTYNSDEISKILNSDRWISNESIEASPVKE